MLLILCEHVGEIVVQEILLYDFINTLTLSPHEFQGD